MFRSCLSSSSSRSPQALVEVDLKAGPSCLLCSCTAESVELPSPKPAESLHKLQRVIPPERSLTQTDLSPKSNMQYICRQDTEKAMQVAACLLKS